jgi:O-antigen/teichoic acid export membrane protein
MLNAQFNKFGNLFKKPAIWSLGVNGISLCLGSVILLSLGIIFEENEQGIYFTFTGLGTLVFFAEFGLGQTIIQLYKHFYDNKEDSKAFQYCVILWFRISLLLLLGALFLVPYFVDFEIDKVSNYNDEWIVFSIFIAWNYYLSKDFYLIQGKDKMLQYWRFRFFEFGIYSLILLALIILGFGISSLLIATCISTFVNFLYLFSTGVFFQEKTTITFLTAFNFWRLHLAKIQFRIGITWLGNNSINRLIIPLVFVTQSAAIAGQYGMSLTLISIGYSVSAILVNIKIPVMSSLIVKKDYGRFEQLFIRGVWQAFTMYLVVISLIAVLLIMLFEYSLFDQFRLLDMNGIFIIFIIYLLLMFINFFACYMRCFKEDLIAKYSFLANCFILILGYFILKNFSLDIFLSSYLLIVLVQFYFSAMSFFRFRRLQRI